MTTNHQLLNNLADFLIGKGTKCPSTQKLLKN